MGSSYEKDGIIMKDGCVASGISSYAPYLDYNGTAYVGFNVIIFEMLMQKLGLCYTYVRPDDGLWGNMMENGSWNGVVGLAIKNEVELIVTMALTHQRYQVIDFSDTMTSTSYAILYPRPSIKPNYLGFVMPFSKQTWFMIFAILFLLVVITLFLKNNSGPKKREDIDGHHHWSIRSRFYLSTHWVFMVLLSQPIVREPKGTGGRLLMLFWLLVTLIIGIIYKSNLKALLISPKVVAPFDDLVGLVNQHEYKWAFLDGSVIFTFFKPAYEEDPNSVMGRAWKMKGEMYTDPNKISSLVLDKKLACLDSTMKVTSVMAEDFSKTGECRFALASERLFNLGLSIGMRKGSILREKLNPYIMRLTEAGIIDKILRGDEINATYCNNPSGKETATDKPLTVDDFLGTFYILFGGWLMASVVFICELLAKESELQIITSFETFIVSNQNDDEDDLSTK